MAAVKPQKTGKQQPKAVPAVVAVPEPVYVGKFLSKWDWASFWVSLIASFAVYFYTLAPSVTLEDSGELAVAGDYLGVPHPPGYPLWSILAWLFARICSFKHNPPIFTQPDPAWGIALLSAVAGALAAAITAMLISRSGRDMLKAVKESGVHSKTDYMISFAGGVAGSLFFAFSQVMWSQSVIVEVYSLNAFFVALILMLSYAWMVKPSNHLIYAIALAFGLGLGNWWPSVLLTLGPIALIFMLKDMKLFRDFAAVGIVVFGMIAFNMLLKSFGDMQIEGGGGYKHPGLAQAQWMLWITGPDQRPFWVYLVINCLAIVLGWMFLPRGRTVALAFILAEIGVLIYIYMPIVSDLRNPPMNWGYPRTWEGFLHAVNRGQYEKIAPTDVFSKLFLDQVGFYLKELRCQFTLPVAILGFLPFAGWSIMALKKRVNAFAIALVLAIGAVVLIVLEHLGGSAAVAETRMYMVLLAANLTLLIIGFTAFSIAEVEEFIGKLRDPLRTSLMEKVLIGMAFAAAFGALCLFEWHIATKLLSTSLPAVAGGPVPPPMTFIGRITLLILMAGPLLLVGFVCWLMYGKPDMQFDFGRNSRKWLIATAFCFGLMSFGMVVGANPRGDIQDMFIQRVKFVTSHGVFAFWIGYGFILSLSYVERLLKNNPLAVWLGVAVSLILPVYPVVQNAPFTENSLNKEMLKAYGGTSMRDHDFGWQFGNYQLRGIEAILEELRPGETPPPTLTYPPPMGPSAVFFGGTDPGRFVPTYMIYSAKVRPDVYLITQNALADNTYMSVMRDLYGEEIWIPSSSDNNEAFRIYHEDVKAGRRPGNIDVRSGRLIVQGVEHVMAINGILCKMIHDFNKWKHDFYVEESYVIPWMYPYMEPHGLILKLNKEVLPSIPEETVKSDMAFWAWYKDRLVKDKKFVYDAVARKSFSKLRSAIAGLYEFRDMREQAEKAYLEAVELCPISPEANFRLAGMYMRYGRFDDAKQLLEAYAKQDPNNSQTFRMLDDISSRTVMMRRKGELEEMLSGGKAQLGTVFELADIYRAMGNMGAFRQVLQNLLQNNALPPDAHLSIGRMYFETKMYDDMDACFKSFLAKAPANMPPDAHKKMAEYYAQAQNLTAASEQMRAYLAKVPVDVAAWHELGVMLAFMQQHGEAARAFQQAIRMGGNKAIDDFKRDPRMSQNLGRPEYRGLLQGMGP